MAKLLENTEADGANGYLKNATTVVPLKNLSNFWRSLEMALFAKLNYNLNGQSIVFCLQLVMIMDNNGFWKVNPKI